MDLQEHNITHKYSTQIHIAKFEIGEMEISILAHLLLLFNRFYRKVQLCATVYRHRYYIERTIHASNSIEPLI